MKVNICPLVFVLVVWLDRLQQASGCPFSASFSYISPHLTHTPIGKTCIYLNGASLAV